MKNLIYFKLTHNQNYLHLMDLCIKSLINTGYEGDLLFITDLQTEIKSRLQIKNKIFFLDPNEYNFVASSANKLKIFQFAEISNYTKILFCDLDILWLKPPEEIFSTIEDGGIYISEEGVDNKHNMSLGFYSENLITKHEEVYMQNHNIIGLNAGFFGFHVNMLPHIKNIFYFMKENVQKISYCLEQPFINVYCFRQKIYKTDLTKFISHTGQDRLQCNKHLLHFAGGVGHFSLKYECMARYIASYLQ